MCSSIFKTSEGDEKDQQKLRCGTYGRVYAVNYLGKTCVEKEMQSNSYSNLVSTVGQERSIRQCLRHVPNTVNYAIPISRYL